MKILDTKVLVEVKEGKEKKISKALKDRQL
jgi:hypothetical protein